MNVFIFIAIPFSFVLLPSLSNAQTSHTYQIGFSVTPELVSDGNRLVWGYGLTFDYNFNKNIGIETGAFPRAYKKTFRVSTGGQSFKVQMKDYHISVPVMFRYNNKIINVAGGPAFDIYAGYKQTTYTDIYTLKYEPKSKFNFGCQGKISKTIWLFENLVFEPEARMAVVFTSNRAYLGLGFTFKYGF